MADGNITTAQWMALVRSTGSVPKAVEQLRASGITAIDGQQINYTPSPIATPTSYLAQSPVASSSAELPPVGSAPSATGDGADLAARSVARQQANRSGGLSALPAEGAPAAAPSPFADIEKLLTGGTSAAAADPAAALAQAAQQYGDIGTAKAQLAKMQYDQAAANLNASRKWTPADWFRLSAAMATPSRTPGFGAFMQNVMPVVADITQSHYMTPRMEAQKRAALQMQYLGALADAREGALKSQAGVYRDILEYGGKGKSFRPVVVGDRVLGEEDVTVPDELKGIVSIDQWSKMTPADRNTFLAEERRKTGRGI